MDPRELKEEFEARAECVRTLIAGGRAAVQRVRGTIERSPALRAQSERIRQDQGLRRRWT